MLAGVTICAICLLSLIALATDGWITPTIKLVLGLLLSSLTVSISLILALRLWKDERRMESLQMDLRVAQDQTDQANQRLEAVLGVNRKVMEAANEKEIIDFLLQVVFQLTSAAGVSYVPIDERSQPLSVIRLGDQSVPVGDDWLEYLASQAVRSSCSECTELESEDPTCPLLRGPFVKARGVICLPVLRREREYGILIVYQPGSRKLDPDTRRFLRSIVDETALAIEGVRLRERELDSYHQLELARQKTDLKAALQDLLDRLRDSLSADFAILDLTATQSKRGSFEIRLETGNLPGSIDHRKLETVMQASVSTQPVIVPLSLLPLISNHGATEGDLMLAYLATSRQESIGYLLVGCRQTGAFLPRQFPLLQTTAGQVTLLVENMQQITELQVRTMMEERNRLAREIHDGLAQTIGYLKLQLVQMQTYLERGEKDHLQDTLKKSYQAISVAYQEARFAIDGLRIAPGDEQLSGWLRQTVDDFRENFSGEVAVFLDLGEIPSRIPSEVQVQLIRVVQEALSNIRKHAAAKNVWISVSLVNQDLCLEIRDDGQGFLPEEISGPYRHGLQGMRERADLIGATFEVQSQLAQGTRVVVRLPLHQEEVLE